MAQKSSSTVSCVHLKFITFSSRQIEVHLAAPAVSAVSLARPQNAESELTMKSFHPISELKWRSGVGHTKLQALFSLQKRLSRKKINELCRFCATAVAEMKHSQQDTMQ